MSLQVLYSFDHILNADLISLPRMVSVSQFTTISGTSGRDNTGCMVSNDALNGALMALDNPHHIVTIGAWIVIEAPSPHPWPFLILGHPTNSDSNDPFGLHIGIGAQMDGSLIIKVGGHLGPNVGQTVGGVFSIGAPFYLEWQSVIGTTGSTIVRVNEVEVLHLNTIDTMQGGDSAVKQIAFTAGQGRVRFDDVYICTGEDNGDGWTGFRGIVKVHAKLVNAAGDIAQWAPSTPTGINWDNVNDDTPSVVDYNDAASVGLTDLYQFEDVAFNPTAIQIDKYLAKLDAGPSSVSAVARIAAVDHVSPIIHSLSTTYKYYKTVYGKQPGGSLWTQAVFNALQAGPRRVV